MTGIVLPTKNLGDKFLRTEFNASVLPLNNDLIALFENAGISLAGITVSEAYNFISMARGSSFLVGGSANAITLTSNTLFSHLPIKRHFEGQIITFLPTYNNTGAVTINIDTLGAIAVKMPDGSNLLPSYFKTTEYARILWNGTNYVFLNAISSIPIGCSIDWEGDKTMIPANFMYENGTSLSVATYPALFAVIGYSFGGSGGNFNLLDTRGRFKRYVNDGSGNDPDASSRTASNAGGNTGDNRGSYQGDENKSHTHPLNIYFYADAYGGQVGNGNNFRGVGGPTGSSGGNESRPKNVYVGYSIIRYQ